MKSDSIYLDYNATSPLAESVKQTLTEGDVFFANPSSLHKLGKQARKQINSCSKKIKSLFSTDYDIVFHSGSTEWINTIFQLGVDDHFFYFESDHSVVTQIAESLSSKGVEATAFSPGKDGSYDVENIVSKIQSSKKNNYLNITWVNNETGVVFPLEKLSDVSSCYIHVDASQVPGKVEKWYTLYDFVDVYSFSSHKFGALKSSGFSFIKDVHSMSPLLLGGKQQSGLRSGTENVLAIECIHNALSELLEKDSYTENLIFRKKIEDLLSSYKDIFIVSKDVKRACNTIGFCVNDQKSDFLSALFDMHGLCVGVGSACQSGQILAAKSLVAMGLKKDAESFIRLSFNIFGQDQQKEILTRLQKVLDTL